MNIKRFCEFKNFIKENCIELYKLTDDVNELLDYIETPNTPQRTVKELKDG